MGNALVVRELGEGGEETCGESNSEFSVLFVFWLDLAADVPVELFFLEGGGV